MNRIHAWGPYLVALVFAVAVGAAFGTWLRGHETLPPVADAVQGVDVAMAVDATALDAPTVATAVDAPAAPSAVATATAP